MQCKYCGKECKNANSLRNHERLCKHNPDGQESPFIKFNKSREHAWNYGLTKETDSRVAKQADSLSKSTKGKHGHKHNEATKEKISKARKKYLSENPDKVPYLVNHSSKISYPEQYFTDLFEVENIDLKYHLQVSKYQLDFYNKEKMIDLEIDGEQHYTDKRIYQSDRERDQFLTSAGWTIKRIRWADYKKLDLDSRQQVILELKSLFNNDMLR